MEKRNQMGGGSTMSSSSFTTELFGPQNPSSSTSTSSSFFGSVFGPNSTGLGRESSKSKYMGSSKRQEFGCQYDNAKHANPDNRSQRSNKVENGSTNLKERNSSYRNETVEPSYLSSSIYYGGQEVYSPNAPTTNSNPIFKKVDEDHNGGNSNGASRGNWWEGSLYY